MVYITANYICCNKFNARGHARVGVKSHATNRIKVTELPWTEMNQS